VENLLNLSRLESGHIKPGMDWCDIVELCYSVAHRVEVDHPGRRISVHVKPDLPLCKTDKGMLDQVLFNLLNNAARHTQPHCQISLQASCYGSLLEFEVKDTGQGFGDMDPKEVFSKFSRQNKGSARVSGLGLSIVKGFTEALGGEVSLQEDQKNGSHFRLTFPVQTSNCKGEGIE
jgi:two-component system sensor histidine kinase KdpD